MEARALAVAVAATFTVDPVTPSIRYFLDRFGIRHEIELAPYNQVLRELIDRAGAFGRSRDGASVAVVRLSDLGSAGGHAKGRPDPAAMRERARDLAEYAAAYAKREGAAPLLVVL